MSKNIKIMIADDQELIRESLKIVLSANPDMEVIEPVSLRERIKAKLGYTIKHYD